MTHHIDENQFEVGPTCPHCGEELSEHPDEVYETYHNDRAALQESVSDGDVWVWTCPYCGERVEINPK